jgi:large subunit ribosomal protein L21
VLKVDKIPGEPGQVVEFGEVLVVGGDSVLLGAPTVAGATVAAEVLDQARGPKIIAFKKRRRKNSRRKRGHRQEFTLLRITEILTEGKKASQTPPPRPKRVAAPKPAVDPDAEAGSDAPESAAAAAGANGKKTGAKTRAKAKPKVKAKAKVKAGKGKPAGARNPMPKGAIKSRKAQ